MFGRGESRVESGEGCYSMVLSLTFLDPEPPLPSSLSVCVKRLEQKVRNELKYQKVRNELKE